MNRPSSAPKKIPKWAWLWLNWHIYLSKHKLSWRDKHKPKPFVPLKGCDYAGKPSTADLKKNGMKFVCRYLSTPGNPKNISRAEVLELHKAGIEIVLVFETVADSARKGYAQGKLDAVSAKAQATAVGAPADAPIYFTVDFDAYNAELLALVKSYFRGINSVLPASRVGVYGGIKVVEAVAQAKLAQFFWQAFAWSYGEWYPGNHIEQYANSVKLATGTVDLDRALKPAFGSW